MPPLTQNLLQNGHHLTISCQICSDALSIIPSAPSSLWSSTDRASTIAQLEGGLFHKLLTRYAAASCVHEKERAVLLTALTMRLGARIGREDLKIVGDVVVQLVQWTGRGVRKQICEALKGFKDDGTPWYFGEGTEFGWVQEQEVARSGQDDWIELRDLKPRFSNSRDVYQDPEEALIRKPFDAFPFEDFEDSGYLSNDENEPSMPTSPLLETTAPALRSPPLEAATSKQCSLVDTAPETGKYRPKDPTLSTQNLGRPRTPTPLRNPKTIWQEICDTDDLSDDDEFRRVIETSPVKAFSRRSPNTEVHTSISNIEEGSRLTKRLRLTPTGMKRVPAAAPIQSSPASTMSKVGGMQSDSGSFTFDRASESRTPGIVSPPEGRTSPSAQNSKIVAICSFPPSDLPKPSNRISKNYASSDTYQIASFPSSIETLYSFAPAHRMELTNKSSSKVNEIYSCPPTSPVDEAPPFTMSEVFEIYSTPTNGRLKTAPEPSEKGDATTCCRSSTKNAPLGALIWGCLILGIWIVGVVLFSELMKH